jgi:FkbH-like protein
MFQLTWKNRAHWRRAGSDRPLPPPPDSRPVSMAAALVWEEHCVECAVPDCYSSCPLFVHRGDGKCSRFSYGIVPNPHVTGFSGQGADIRFRRWGKLEAYWPGRPAFHPPGRLKWASKLLDGLERFEAVTRNLPLPSRFSSAAGERLRKIRKRLIRDRLVRTDSSIGADALVVQFHSPQSGTYCLQLEIDRHTDVPKVNPITFRRALDVRPGWNRHEIPASELPKDPGKIRLWPDGDAEIRLVFTHLDLVRFADQQASAVEVPAAAPAAKVKCVAWDLDGTLWDGVIGEIGADAVEPRVAAINLIRALDERGILQTIASKNDFDAAWPKIEALGLDEVFLFPAIHWGPKSVSLKDQAAELNINADTFAFIDDSSFERAEVAAACPQVRVYDADDVPTLLARPEFDVPVTDVSRNRRQSYRAEARRRAIGAGWRDDMDGFLRSCRMVMRIGPPDPGQRARCLELLQRSNQFNLSGKRYTAESFDTLLADPGFECLAFDLADDFGAYGVVGFAAIRHQPGGPVLVDFVMSCRVAQKRIEETFLGWYAARAQKGGARRFTVRMEKTERNGPLRDALAKTGLPAGATDEDGTALSFVYDLSGELKVPDVVRVESSIPDPTGLADMESPPELKEMTPVDR